MQAETYGDDAIRRSADLRARATRARADAAALRTQGDDLLNILFTTLETASTALERTEYLSRQPWCRVPGYRRVRKPGLNHPRPRGSRGITAGHTG